MHADQEEEEYLGQVCRYIESTDKKREDARSSFESLRAAKSRCMNRAVICVVVHKLELPSKEHSFSKFLLARIALTATMTRNLDNSSAEAQRRCKANAQPLDHHNHGKGHGVDSGDA